MLKEFVDAKFMKVLGLFSNISNIKVVFYPPFSQKGNMNENWQTRKPNNYEAFKLSHNNYCMIATLLFYIQIYKFLHCFVIFPLE
jgi:hypothetical protein